MGDSSALMAQDDYAYLNARHSSNPFDRPLARTYSDDLSHLSRPTLAPRPYPPTHHRANTLPAPQGDNPFASSDDSLPYQQAFHEAASESMFDLPVHGVQEGNLKNHPALPNRDMKPGDGKRDVSSPTSSRGTRDSKDSSEENPFK